MEIKALIQNFLRSPADELTREQAIELAKSNWWVGLDFKTVATSQLKQSKLCMDFSDFHKAVKEAAGKPVLSHEFTDRKRLLSMIDGDDVCGALDMDVLKGKEVILVNIHDE